MKRTTKSKLKKLQSPCPLCGEEIETIWMMDGSVRAVEPERVRVIISNHANAAGREVLAWVPHHNCEKGE